MLPIGAVFVGAGMLGDAIPLATIYGCVLMFVAVLLGVRARRLGVRIFDPTAEPRDDATRKG